MYLSNEYEYWDKCEYFMLKVLVTTTLDNIHISTCGSILETTQYCTFVDCMCFGYVLHRIIELITGHEIIVNKLCALTTPKVRR